jgi:hypothetical protein
MSFYSIYLQESRFVEKLAVVREAKKYPIYTEFAVLLPHLYASAALLHA